MTQSHPTFPQVVPPLRVMARLPAFLFASFGGFALTTWLKKLKAIFSRGLSMTSSRVTTPGGGTTAAYAEGGQSEDCFGM